MGWSHLKDLADHEPVVQLSVAAKKMAPVQYRGHGRLEPFIPFIALL
ncbi:hypothetical protein [Peribacillus simplex]|nr:hypothetical protein [Peribacillus simplex]MEC1396704.1 hypothetical protein [Peribacillus simplex]MED3909709.1 hypothetical protein [Peribacillus simplex]MED3985145.1 hypothetical protein [Peribacillus simplex]MED4093255.1 hypothetical protein [Peribacillus simplex]